VSTENDELNRAAYQLDNFAHRCVERAQAEGASDSQRRNLLIEAFCYLWSGAKLRHLPRPSTDALGGQDKAS